MDTKLGQVQRIAVLVVAVMLTAAVASSIVPSLQVCSQQLAQTGDAGVVTVCGPWLGGVAILGLALLLVVLILLPVLSKFDIAGLLSVELKADQAAKRADEASELATQVQKHAAELAAVQKELREIQEQILARMLVQPSSAEFTQHTSEIGTEADVVEDAGGDPRGGLVTALLGMWEELRAFDDRLISRGDTAPTPVIWGRTLAWKRKYKFEIAQVSAVRNQVAHGVEVDMLELERAVVLARRLLDAAAASIPTSEPRAGA